MAASPSTAPSPRGLGQRTVLGHHGERSHFAAIDQVLEDDPLIMDLARGRAERLLHVHRAVEREPVEADAVGQEPAGQLRGAVRVATGDRLGGRGPDLGGTGERGRLQRRHDGGGHLALGEGQHGREAYRPVFGIIRPRAEAASARRLGGDAQPPCRPDQVPNACGEFVVNLGPPRDEARGRDRTTGLLFPGLPPLRQGLSHCRTGAAARGGPAQDPGRHPDRGRVRTIEGGGRPRRRAGRIGPAGRWRVRLAPHPRISARSRRFGAARRGRGPGREYPGTHPAG